MSWDTVRLGDIASFSNGINFDKTAYSHGVKLIGVSDFGNRFFPDIANLREVKKEVVRDSDLLKEGDIVFVRSNGNKELVGRCMLINHITQPITFSGFVIRGRILDTEKYDQVYFTYHFKNIAFRRAMSGTAVGANIQNLSQGILSAYVAKIPDIDTQHKIANYLSSYDSLIENNQKQIKLLEEAAQRLYKEWFVDLRFPGYKDTPIVDGVPEGWERLPVGELIEKIPRTTQIMASEYGKEGPIPIIDQSREFIAGYTDNHASLVNVGKPVIVFGDHTRILKYIQFPFAKGADGTQLIVSNTDRMPQSLFYCSLVGVDLSNYHYARHFKYLKAEELLVPTQVIAEAFDRFVSPMFSKIQRLRDINKAATNARDRLLPKLMSGEIEV